MSERVDLLRSLFRSAAQRTGARLGALGPVAGLRRLVGDLSRRGARVEARTLSEAIAHAPGVEAASVRASAGAIRVEATIKGSDLSFALIPAGARFAPRGAKELLLRVDPPALAADLRVQDVGGAVAAVVARALYGLIVREGWDAGGAIADRDGDLLRYDLRTVPALRPAAAGGPLGALLEVLELGELVVADGELRLLLRPPPVFGPR